MKSVLISIQPKWCELIASGKKIIEVRKTRPKIKTPFTVYIYQTRKPVSVSFSGTGRHISEYDKTYYYNKRSGKVIGEFLCKSTLPISVTYSDPNNKIALREFPYTCLTDKEIMDYLGNGKQGWGWHISNLVIYDKPKELSEFVVEGDCSCNDCNECKWFDKGNGYNVEDDCRLPYEYDFKSVKPLKRPPQSWCYVETQ